MQLRGPSRVDPALLGILLLGIGLRLISITTPLLDAHSWRQIDTATMARYFYQDGPNPFFPQVNWGGPHGYVESEFPLVPLIAVLPYYIFGPDDMWGRVTCVAFSVALIVSVYLLVTELRGRPAGRAAALLVAASPAAVYYGRTFMPDTAMLFLSIAALLGIVKYLTSGSRRALIWGSLALALGVLVKLPAVLVLAPIAGAAAQARGRGVLKDRPLWAGVGAALLVSSIWYVHAYRIFRDTGLTFGILAHPARTYPAVISPGPWPDVFSKWSTAAMLGDPGFYGELLDRLVRLHLTPVGLTLALLGLLLWRGRWNLVPGAWLAAMIAFILVAGHGNIAHDYYQLPLVVIGAMYFGAAAGPVFDREWIRSRVAGGSWAAAAVAAVIAAMAVLMFFESGVLRSHFRQGRLNDEMVRAGAAISHAVEPDALLVVVDDYGVTSPVLLYFANRRGWSFGPKDLRPPTIEWLRQVGADYFVTTDWRDIARENGELANYLSRYRPVPLSGGPADTRVFDLRLAE
jgi:4-amino-4-deoxy-L-arabinose transferase-like glycosyltransferase